MKLYLEVISRLIFAGELIAVLYVSVSDHVTFIYLNFYFIKSINLTHTLINTKQITMVFGIHKSVVPPQDQVVYSSSHRPVLGKHKKALYGTDNVKVAKKHRPFMNKHKSQVGIVQQPIMPKHKGLKTHRWSKSTTTPKVGIVGRIKLMLNRLLNFTKLNNNKMITNGTTTKPMYTKTKHVRSSKLY